MEKIFGREVIGQIITIGASKELSSTYSPQIWTALMFSHTYEMSQTNLNKLSIRNTLAVGISVIDGKSRHVSTLTFIN